MAQIFLTVELLSFALKLHRYLRRKRFANGLIDIAAQLRRQLAVRLVDSRLDGTLDDRRLLVEIALDSIDALA